jgi:hypothetical protein
VKSTTSFSIESSPVGRYVQSNETGETANSLLRPQPSPHLRADSRELAGVRKIAAQFRVDPWTVQRISRPPAMTA